MRQITRGFHGHGPGFRDKANEIGTHLELGPVRTSKKRGPKKDLPSCSQWPHCIRPLEHYLGAFRPPAESRSCWTATNSKIHAQRSMRFNAIQTLFALMRYAESLFQRSRPLVRMRGGGLEPPRKAREARKIALVTLRRVASHGGVWPPGAKGPPAGRRPSRGPGAPTHTSVSARVEDDGTSGVFREIGLYLQSMIKRETHGAAGAVVVAPPFYQLEGPMMRLQSSIEFHVQGICRLSALGASVLIPQPRTTFRTKRIVSAKDTRTSNPSRRAF
jgi:hypothetical protein